MIVPGTRSRAGSSRADFIGVEPRQQTPVLEDRRPSQLTGFAKEVHRWTEEFRNYKWPAMYEPSDPPSLILNGASEFKAQIELSSKSDTHKKEFVNFSVRPPCDRLKQTF